MKMIFFYSHTNEIRFLFVRFLNLAWIQSFEVGQESGPVLRRTALWDCFGGRSLTQFPLQPRNIRQKGDSVCKQYHSVIGDDTDSVLRTTLNRPIN